MRAALSPGATDWSLYWYDANGYGSSLYLKSTGFEYYYGGATHFQPVADMTAFHTFTTYVLAGVIFHHHRQGYWLWADAATRQQVRDEREAAAALEKARKDKVEADAKAKVEAETKTPAK